jgi:hypothetical protein
VGGGRAAADPDEPGRFLVGSDSDFDFDFDLGTTASKSKSKSKSRSPGRLYITTSSDVQCGQRLASMGMSDVQYSHFFMDGATGSGVSAGRLSLLM